MQHGHHLGRIQYRAATHGNNSLALFRSQQGFTFLYLLKRGVG